MLMRRKTLSTIVTFLLLMVGPDCRAQGKEEPLFDVQKLMTVAEFTKTGFTKLSPEELRAFNLWLSQYALRVYDAASKPSGPPTATATSPPDVIETQTDDEFDGWDVRPFLNWLMVRYGSNHPMLTPIITPTAPRF